MDPHVERHGRPLRHPSQRRQHADPQAIITGEEDYDENGNLRFVLDAVPSGDEDYDEHDNLRFDVGNTPIPTPPHASRETGLSRAALDVSGPQPQTSDSHPPPGVGDRQWAWILSQLGQTRKYYTPSINSRIEPIKLTSSAHSRRHSGDSGGSRLRSQAESTSNRRSSRGSHNIPPQHNGQHSQRGEHHGERHQSRRHSQSSQHGHGQPPRPTREASRRKNRDKDTARAVGSTEPQVLVSPPAIIMGYTPEKKRRDRNRR